MTFLKLTFIALCGIYSSLAFSDWDSARPVDGQDANGAINIPYSPKASAEQAAAATPQASGAYAPGLRIAQNLINDGDPTKMLLSEAANATVGITQSALRQYLPTFELSLSFEEHNKPAFSVLGVIPLYESADKVNTLFNQSSIYRQDDRTTINLGLGYRRLVADEHVLLGVNAFYDHEFPYDHARTSIGGEIRTSVAELNANAYHGASGWRAGRNGLQERAMGGYDIEAGIALPYLPQVRAYGKHFQWDATGGVADLKGNTLSVKGTPYPGITLELGRNFYDTSSGVSNSSFASLQLDVVTLAEGSANAKPFFSDQAYQLTSMVEHRYDKVRRENIIQKQTHFGVTASGI